MRLESIEVEDYKSIKKLDWKLSNNLTCLVGQNESGKSNVIELFNILDFAAIENLDPDTVTHRTSDRYINGNSPLIKAKYSLNSKSKKALIEGLTPYNNDPDHLKEINLFDTLIIQSELDKTSESRIYFLYGEGNVRYEDYVQNVAHIPHAKKLLDTLRTQIVELHDDYIDQFESTSQELKANSMSDASLPKLLRLAGLNDFSRLSDDPIKLKRYLNQLTTKLNQNFTRKYYSQDNSVELRIINDGNKIYLEISDDSGAEYAIHERSAGFQYFFGLLIELATISNNDNDVIFILDEPGAKLHPSGQRDLLKYLEDLSLDYRIVYSTHSPFMINRLYPNRVKVIEKNKSRGTIFKEKGFSKNWYPLRSALGLSLSDSFYYSEKALLVEGPEDIVYLTSLMNYFNKIGELNINTDIFSFIDAGGVTNLPAMVQIMIDDERPIMVLMDSDSPKTYSRLKKKSNDLKSGLMIVNQINEFDEKAISIEDLLPSEMLRKAYNLYLKELVLEGVLTPKEKEVELKGKLPDNEVYKRVFRTHTIENYVSESKIDDDWENEKVPISKVGIARNFEKLLDSVNWDEEKEHFKPTLKLIKKITEKLKLKI